MEVDQSASTVRSLLDTPWRGVAVVAEGGGQRGIFTAGVLDAFLDEQFNPFELGIGVSAGAQNLLSYFMGEQGYAKRVIETLTVEPDFFVPYRLLGERGMLDLDKYFETTGSDAKYKLPEHKMAKIQQQRQLIFVATHQQTLSPVYLEPDRESVFTCLKASSALPLLYKKPVNIDGQPLVDGGVADPIPVLKAIEMGATHIVVIRTISDKAQQSNWLEHIETESLLHVLPDSVSQMLATHNKANDCAINSIKHPPEGIKIISIAPTEPLRSSALGSSSDAIAEDYVFGNNAGVAALEVLQHWLPEQN